MTFDSRFYVRVVSRHQWITFSIYQVIIVEPFYRFEICNYAKLLRFASIKVFTVSSKTYKFSTKYLASLKYVMVESQIISPEND